VGRLLALVLLRLRLELRSFAGARERALGLLLIVPGLLFASGLISLLVYFGVRALDRAQPEAVLPVLSALVTLFGVLFCLQPLLSGVALTETHDLRQVVHYPVPFPTLALSSLIANLFQPVVLSELPVTLALALALAGASPRLALAWFGALLSLVSMLAAAQTVGFVLQALSRHRRLRDFVLSFGLLLGFSASLMPLLLLSHGGPLLARMARFLVFTDLFKMSPLAWGVRAGAYGAQGDAVLFGSFAFLSAFFSLACMLASGLLVSRIYRGELDLGPSGLSDVTARMIFPGPVGAVIEKDLRSAWRDPALRMLLLIGLTGPLLLLFFLLQSGRGARGGGGLLLLAVFVGISTFGGNVLGFERRGIGLLLSFPVPRWRVLVAKNLAMSLLRLPHVGIVALAGMLMAPLSAVPCVLVALGATLLIAAGADNYLSILFPVPVPAPGQSPHAGASGGRGLAAIAISSLFLTGALALAAPFIFLAWLPRLLERPSLALVTLPLAVAGAAAAYAMLVAGAARLFESREPELIERILVEQ
jgi:ABC-2 type transport system permease protein